MNDIPDVPKQTPGQIIKAAREAKRISLNEVAQRLLLSKKIIIAIEDDDYAKIPAQVYAEGYLKAYAQFLDIPSGEVIEVFRSLNFYPDDTVAKEARHKAAAWKEILKLKERKHLLSSILGFLFLIVVIFLLKTFFYKDVSVTEIAEPKDESAISASASGEADNLEQGGDADLRTITLDLSRDMNGSSKRR